MKKPRQIEGERLHPPLSGRIAWLAWPKAKGPLACISQIDKAAAEKHIRGMIERDGVDPEECELIWTLLESGYGWTARLKS